MRFSPDSLKKWQARLEIDGYDPKAVKACIEQIRDKTTDEIQNPIGYLRSMLVSYSHGSSSEKLPLPRNTYDPGWWWREKMLGSQLRRPNECSVCGWVHEEIEPHAELCWCGHPHQLPNLHVRAER